MKLFVCSDLHSFYTPFKKALDEAGFDPNNQEHLLIVCGDVFDRGDESVEMLKYLRGLTNVVLVKGNHEDLLEDVWERGYMLSHDVSNGTKKTIQDIFRRYSDIAPYEAVEVSEKVLKPFLNKMVNYFETKNYIFVHGWIPCDTPSYSGRAWWQNNRKLAYNSEWRNSSDETWKAARWINGIDAGYLKKVIEPGKTIVCGHWHCSYGHYWKAVKKSIENGDTIFEAEASEFDENAIWEPFKADGIMAIDRCTAHTGEVNVIVLEDELLEKM